MQLLCCFGSGRQVHDTEFYVPPRGHSAGFICKYVKDVYDVETKITQNSRKIQLKCGSKKDMFDAQELARSFFQQEVKFTIELPNKALQLYTCRSVRKYLWRRLQIIVTIFDDRALRFRGPSHAISILETALCKHETSTPMNDARLRSLEEICKRIGMNILELVGFDPPLLSAFLDVVVAVEHSYGSCKFYSL